MTDSFATTEYASVDRAARAPTVTSLIPNYNHAHLLPRVVRAHLEQTLPPTTILLVDDASTDDSVAVAEQLCREYPAVKLVRRPRNGGPNAALNTGLAHVATDFVTFAAADDLIEPTFFQRSVEALQRFPSAAFSFLDPSRRFIGSAEAENVPLALAKVPTLFTPDAFEALFRRNSFTISSNTVVYRSQAIASIGGFHVELDWQSDWMANLVLAFRHGAAYVPEALAHVMVNPHSYGQVGVRSREGQQRLLFKCLAVIESDYPDVADRFRRACLLPEMRFRNVFWLAQSALGRRFLTPQLVMKLALREIWTYLRPATPMAIRRWMRRQIA